MEKKEEDKRIETIKYEINGYQSGQRACITQPHTVREECATRNDYWNDETSDPAALTAVCGTEAGPVTVSETKRIKIIGSLDKVAAPNLGVATLHLAICC